MTIILCVAEKKENSLTIAVQWPAGQLTTLYISAVEQFGSCELGVIVARVNRPRGKLQMASLGETKCDLHWRN